MSAPPTTGGDAFTRVRLTWLEAVAAEADLPATAYRLATIVALRYMSRARGFAWPSIATLCADLGVGKTAVIRAIAALESHGLLTVVRSRGRGRANEYRLAASTKKGSQNETISDGGKGIQNETISCRKGIGVAPEKVSAAPPQPVEEPIEGAGESRLALRA